VIVSITFDVVLVGVIAPRVNVLCMIHNNRLGY
jgi:hypothetical protein